MKSMQSDNVHNPFSIIFFNDTSTTQKKSLSISHANGYGYPECDSKYAGDVLEHIHVR